MFSKNAVWLKLLLLGQKRRALGYNSENNPYCPEFRPVRRKNAAGTEIKTRPRECAMQAPSRRLCRQPIVREVWRRG
jgi:hypothetical protein